MGEVVWLYLLSSAPKRGKTRVSHRVMILGNDRVIDLRNVVQIFPSVIMFGSVLKMDSVHDFLLLSL